MKKNVKHFDYVVASGGEEYVLATDVDRWLRSGFEPIGGISVVKEGRNIRFYQSMYRKKPN